MNMLLYATFQGITEWLGVNCGLVLKGFPYVLWDMDSKYQDIEEVVPRKLYKAWDRDKQAMVALKLVEVYGFEAASAWADHHVAVPSVLVRKLPGGFSLVSMPWLAKDQGWSILSSLSATQMESDSVWPAIQEMLGRAHAPYLHWILEAAQVLEVRYVHGDSPFVDKFGTWFSAEPFRLLFL
ncbi:hypothetical protein WJX77_001602 [Trebouxia sp. C0004]